MLWRSARVFTNKMGEFAHILDRLKREAGQLHRRTRRHDGASKSKLHGLFEAEFGLRRRAHVARKADLTEKYAIPRKRPAGEGRKKRRGRRQIGRRLAHFETAGHVQIDIMGADAKARPG